MSVRAGTRRRPLDWLTLLRCYGSLIWLLPLVVFMPFLWRSEDAICDDSRDGDRGSLAD